MDILIFSPGYPSQGKSEYPFVKQLVDAWADLGNHCTVIATYSITKNRNFYRYRTFEQHANGGDVTILRPNIPTFSNFRISTCSLTSYFQRLGIKYALKSIENRPDVVYCHFWQSGADGYLYSQKKQIPLFIATGESDIKRLLKGTDLTFIDSVKGVICVSSKNRDESIALGLTTMRKCSVFPNAVDTTKFYKMDKLECRKKLGLPLNAYIVIFVGWFDERKGVKRVEAALQSIEEDNVFSIFIGSGSQVPVCKNILYKGRLMHDDIPVYLNAADVFVLPTLKEGCCNAVIEAMACGLPIISSNKPFNWDILNEDNSILVDPLNIEEIKAAILKLRDNQNLKFTMSCMSLKKAESLSISKRATDILSFMKRNL